MKGFDFLVRKSDFEDLEFHNGGYFSTDKEWIHGTRTIGDNELIIVVKGDIYIFEDDEKYHLSGGDYLVLEKGHCHGGYMASTGSTEFFWLHFEKASEPGIKKSGKLVNSSIIIQSARQLLQISETPLYPENTASNMLKVLFSEIFVQCESDGPQNAFAIKIHEYIRSHSYEIKSVKDVSKHFGYNPDYLSKILKKSYGISLKHDIANERINRAKFLLQTTDMQITEIAFELGYDDPNLFDKFFIYHAGCTPTEYKSAFAKLHTNHK